MSYNDPHGKGRNKNRGVDALWDWDARDYKEELIVDGEKYRCQLEDFWNQYPRETAILLLHDFDRNPHLFEETMTFLLRKKVNFLEFENL